MVFSRHTVRFARKPKIKNKTKYEIKTKKRAKIKIELPT